MTQLDLQLKYYSLSRLILRRQTTAVLALSLALTSGAVSVRAADLPGTFDGNASASYGNATTGPFLSGLASTAFETCPCRGTKGQALQNTTKGVSVGAGGSVLTASSTASSVDTNKSSTNALVIDSTTINGLGMLSGMITADSVTAAARAGATTTTMAVSTAGSGFNNLRIAGKSYPDQVPPNTVVALPGIGTVTLNERKKNGNFSGYVHIDQVMLSLVVTQTNAFGLPVGANIIVGRASAGYSRIQPSVLTGGKAFVSAALNTVGTDLTNEVGHAGFVGIGCDGTKGKTLTNSVKLLDVSGLLSLGNGATSAVSGPMGAGTYAKTTSSVGSVNLLGGMITGTNIMAVAKETLTNGALSVSTAGSGFGALTIAGKSIPTNAPPNTTVPLPGVGKVVVNEQIAPRRVGGSAAVSGLHVYVTTPNTFSLPVGAELVIARATALTEPF